MCRSSMTCKALPGPSRTSPAAKRFAHARRPAREGPLLATMKAPAWVYLRGPFNFASSTAIRDRQRGTATLET